MVVPAAPICPPLQAHVFSVQTYVPSWLDESRVWIIPPSIDPFSPKNEEHRRGTPSCGHFAVSGSCPRSGARPPAPFTRRDGTRGLRRAPGLDRVVDGSPLDPEAPLVVQVSRWDRLKDMTGVMEGFAASRGRTTDAQLALVGPSSNAGVRRPGGDRSVRANACRPGVVSL